MFLRIGKVGCLLHERLNPLSGFNRVVYSDKQRSYTVSHERVCARGQSDARCVGNNVLRISVAMPSFEHLP
jgi:hypothetical protein